MAYTILDRINDSQSEDGSLHGVDFAMPFAKNMTKVGGKEYKFKSKTGGHSARDIIRVDQNSKAFNKNATWIDGVQYPIDVVKAKRIRIDPSIDADYLGVHPATGEIVPLKAKTAGQARSEAGFMTVKPNFKPRRADKFEKNALKAVADVKNFRDSYYMQFDPTNDRYQQGMKAYKDLSDVQYAKNFVADFDKTDAGKQRYGTDWRSFVDARKRSKEAGHEIAKRFSERNKAEKEVYQNLVDGNYTLGGENHTFADDNRNQDSYEDIDFLRRNRRKIQFDENGNPVVKGYHWTDKGNIEPIMQTGLLDMVGPDSKAYGAMSGAWTSGNDKNPMYKNFFNGGTIGSGNFNEDLIEVTTPLKDYNAARVTHDPMSSAKVDIMNAKPSAPVVAIGEGANRKLAKIAMPASNMVVHREDDPYFDYYQIDDSSFPGWHPNMEGNPHYSIGNVALDIADAARFNLPNGEQKAKEIRAEVLANTGNRARLDGLKNLIKNKDLMEAYKKFKIKEKFGGGESYSAITSDKVPEDRLMDAARLYSYNNLDITRPRDLLKTPNANVARGAISRAYYDEYGNRVNRQYMFDNYNNRDLAYAGNVRNYLTNNVFDKLSFEDLKDKLTLGNNPNAYIPKNLMSQMQGKFKNLYDMQPSAYDYADKAGINTREIAHNIKSANNKEYEFKRWERGDQNAYSALPIERRLDKYKTEKQKYQRDRYNDSVRELTDTMNRLISEGKTEDALVIQNELKRMATSDYPQLDVDEKLALVQEMNRRTGENPFGNTDEIRRKYSQQQMQADSLNKVIGHTLGRKIGAYRASRGKYGLDK